MSELNPFLLDDSDVSDTAELEDQHRAASSSSVGSTHVDIQQLHRRVDAIDNEICDLEETAAQIASSIHRLKNERKAISEKLFTAQAIKVAAENRKNWADTSTFAWSAQVQKARSKLLGPNVQFRNNQLEVINASLSGCDTFVIAPTGGGKTLCFLVPTLVVETGFTLVISPLISLMHDQVEGARRHGLHAQLLCKDMDAQVKRTTIKNLSSKKNTIRLLYVTPEMFVNSKTLLSNLEKAHDQQLLNRIVLDEAHCCSEWGHDFRPDYSSLNIIKIQFKDVPLMCLTATATFQVQKDIKKILGIPGCEMFRSSTLRKNLRYLVHSKDDSDDKAKDISTIAAWITKHHKHDAGIVYCLSRNDTMRVCQGLRLKGVIAAVYHADMTLQDKTRVHDEWLADRIRVVVATTAFGMGIDKLNVRFVVHHSMSKNIEAYYQESGRAGRDGAPADCVLYYSPQDYIRMSTLVCYDRFGLDRLLPLAKYCQTRRACRKAMLAARFEETITPTQCGRMCDVCLHPDAVVQKDVTASARGLLDLVTKLKDANELRTPRACRDLWRGVGLKGTPLAKDTLSLAPKGAWTRQGIDHLIVQMLCDDVLQLAFKNTAYSTNCYLVPGPRAGDVRAGRRRIHIEQNSPAVCDESLDNAAAHTSSSTKQSTASSSGHTQVSRTKRSAASSSGHAQVSRKHGRAKAHGTDQQQARAGSTVRRNGKAKMRRIDFESSSSSSDSDWCITRHSGR
eukprot:m.1316519 g.1316519  ORF g.1316519 m.1316519 type:complete len:735 (-) comp24837_c1_seq35:56-2260(-)